MRKRTSIPVYSMEGSIMLTELTNRDIERLPIGAHRDNNYLFLLHESGKATMMLDFKEITSNGNTLICILPGQVHYGAADNIKGWVLGLDASMVPAIYRPVFEDNVLSSQPVAVTKAAITAIKQCASLLQDAYQQEDRPFGKQIVQSLIDTFIGLFATAYASRQPFLPPPDHRTTIITRQFKELLTNNYKTMKSPSAYAATLNISASYLNEAVKYTTGLSVSHWIQQEVINEAKRMLYYTSNTVKEIAYELGYEDHTYFNRLFTKITGMSPLAFRHKYRE
jgi:AraC family transcriptional regulator, transcriptional activator of pobA